MESQTLERGKARRKATPASKKQMEQDLVQWHLEQIEIGATTGRHPVITTVTPELAKIILENNPDNRNLRKYKVEQFVRDLRHGRYKFNGESIVIANTGELNDGQHRLTAIVESGIPAEILLMYGPERDSRFTVDVGSARTAGDHLALGGQAHSISLAATARLAMAYERTGGESLGRTNDFSSAEVVERVQEDDLLRECTIWVSNHHSKLRMMGSKSVLGFVFYTLSKVNPKYAMTFMEAMKEGIGLSGDSPIRLARERLLTSPKLSAVQKVEIIFRGWNAWVADRNITRLPVTGRLPELES